MARSADLRLIRKGQLPSYAFVPGVADMGENGHVEMPEGPSNFNSVFPSSQHKFALIQKVKPIRTELLRTQVNPRTVTVTPQVVRPRGSEDISIVIWMP